jgi:hypothetical protein
MRGASRGVLKWSSQTWAGAENSAGFCLGRTGLAPPVCGACGFASQAKPREATGLRPAGTTTRPRGAFAGLGLGETTAAGHTR